MPSSYATRALTPDLAGPSCRAPRLDVPDAPTAETGQENFPNFFLIRISTQAVTGAEHGPPTTVIPTP